MIQSDRCRSTSLLPIRLHCSRHCITERLNPYALRSTGKILLLVDTHDRQLHSDRRDSAQPTHHSPQSSLVQMSIYFELNMPVMN